MLEVAQWVVANTPFDRLYFYGDDKPIHVSYGSNHDRQIVRMVPSKSGRLVPRVVSSDIFLESYLLSSSLKSAISALQTNKEDAA